MKFQSSVLTVVMHVIEYLVVLKSHVPSRIKIAMIWLVLWVFISQKSGRRQRACDLYQSQVFVSRNWPKLSTHTSHSIHTRRCEYTRLENLSTRFVTSILYLLYSVLDWVLTSRVGTQGELVKTLHTGTVTRRLVTVPACRVFTRSPWVPTLDVSTQSWTKYNR